MPIAIMEGSNRDQQDVSMEGGTHSSRSVSPAKNGTSLKRKAGEDLALVDETGGDVVMVDMEQELGLKSTDNKSPSGMTQKDGESQFLIPCS